MANAQDATFVQQAAQSNLTEITESMLALKSSLSVGVDVYGAWMVSDHSNADVMLYNAASPLGLPVATTLDATHQAEVNALENTLLPASGVSFDTTYLTDQVTDHQATLQSLQQEVQNGQDPGLVALASSMIPMVTAHLNTAENLLAVQQASTTTPPPSVTATSIQSMPSFLAEMGISAPGTLPAAAPAAPPPGGTASSLHAPPDAAAMIAPHTSHGF